MLNISHYCTSIHLMHKIYALTCFIASKNSLTAFLVITRSTILHNNYLLKTPRKKQTKSSMLFSKFIPLILSFGNPSLGAHVANSAFYATNSSGYPQTFSLAKSFISFNKVLMFLEYIIKNKVPLMVFSTKLLYKLSSRFYNYSFFKLNRLRQYNIMKFFATKSALLMSPQKAISTLEMLSINILVVLDVNYYLRLLSSFTKKGFFSIGLIEASVNSNFISLPLVVNKVSLMQQVLILRLLFYIKSKSGRVLFNELKTLFTTAG